MSVKSNLIGTLEFRCVIREDRNGYFLANCTDLYMKKITTLLDRYKVDFVPRNGTYGVKVKYVTVSPTDHDNANETIKEKLNKYIREATIVDVAVIAKMNRCKIANGRTSTSISFIAKTVEVAPIDAMSDMSTIRF
jgi:hypothetical protein